MIAVVLVVLGGLVLWGHKFASNMVHDELSAQRIYFPEAGAPNFDPEKYASIQKFAGQLVDSGAKAKAYANDYIGQHLKDIGQGKTYSEVSALAQQNPDDENLQTMRQSLLQGETLRGVLLGTGYAFGTIATIAGFAVIGLFVAAVCLVILGVYFHVKRG